MHPIKNIGIVTGQSDDIHAIKGNSSSILGFVFGMSFLCKNNIVETNNANAIKNPTIYMII